MRITGEAVKEDVKKVANAAKQPRFSIFTLLYLIVVIIAFIVLETDLLDEVPRVIKVCIYIGFVLGSAVFGHSNILIMVSSLNRILNDKTKTTVQKLNEILDLMISCSYWAGRYYEESTDKIEGDKTG